jgi:hypothetical protein
MKGQGQVDEKMIPEMSDLLKDLRPLIRKRSAERFKGQGQA